MKNGFFGLFVICLLATTGVLGQTPPEPAPLTGAPAAFPTVPPPADWPGEEGAIWGACCGNSAAGPSCFWINTEYLLWRIKDAPLPIPVVTTTTQPQLLVPGALGQPGTSVLYGGSPVNLGTFSGTRLTAGGWLNGARTIGIEASAFLLEQRSAFFNARSDANGNPFLGLPYFDPASGANTALPVTYPPVPPPGFSRGAVTVASSTRLWGSEANGLFNVLRGDSLAIDLLGGFRYLDLQEGLGITGNGFITDSDGVSTVNAIGTDYFGTHNQFYGGQLGARLNWYGQKWFLNVCGKVALGETHQTLSVNGNSQVLNPTGDFVGIAPPVSLGSVYSQPTNIGQSSVNRFTVVPEIQFKIGYALTSHCRAFVGYDFLYWGSVLRPGNQLDGSVNDTQRFGQPLVGAAQPQPILQQSSFWAQGVSFGLQFAF